MKTYYAECTVSFTDNSDETPWKSNETYSFIIQAKNKLKAKTQAVNLAKDELKEQLGKMDDVKVVIDTFYLTFDNSRAD
jgi:hypothetical protein